MESALERFARVLPWTVLATDDFVRDGVARMNRVVAAGRREIAPDPPGWLTALRFDVDGADAGTRWLDAGLPPPNLVVRRRSNGHAHLIYQLAIWLPTRDHGPDAGVRFSPAALRYAAAIDRAMTAALGADPAYAGRFHHNPLAGDEWEVREVRAEPYSLAELAQHVDLQAVPRSAPTSSGIGRNVAVFERLRRWAASVADRHAGADVARWEAVLAPRAAAIAEQIRGEYPHASHRYSDAEVRATVRSIARYRAARATGKATGVLAAAAAIVTAKRTRERAERYRRNRGAVPRAEYLADAARRREEIHRLAAAGLSAVAIAEQLDVTTRTVYRTLSEAAVAPGATIPASADGNTADDPTAALGAAMDAIPGAPRPSSRRPDVVTCPSRHQNLAGERAYARSAPCEPVGLLEYAIRVLPPATSAPIDLDRLLSIPLPFDVRRDAKPPSTDGVRIRFDDSG